MKYVTMTNTNFSKMELTEGFIDKLLDYMDYGVQLNGLDKTSVKICSKSLFQWTRTSGCYCRFRHLLHATSLSVLLQKKTIRQLKENRYMAPRIDLTGDSSMPPTPGIWTKSDIRVSISWLLKAKITNIFWICILMIALPSKTQIKSCDKLYVTSIYQ